MFSLIQELILKISIYTSPNMSETQRNNLHRTNNIYLMMKVCGRNMLLSNKWR
jgi:hypothetical protein